MLKLTGEMGEFRRDPLGLLERLQHEQGDMARFRMGLSRIVLLGHPSLVEQVLVTEKLITLLSEDPRHFGSLFVEQVLD